MTLNWLSGVGFGLPENFNTFAQTRSAYVWAENARKDRTLLRKTMVASSK